MRQTHQKINKFDILKKGLCIWEVNMTQDFILILNILLREKQRPQQVSKQSIINRLCIFKIIITHQISLFPLLMTSLFCINIFTRKYKNICFIDAHVQVYTLRIVYTNTHTHMSSGVHPQIYFLTSKYILLAKCVVWWVRKKYVKEGKPCTRE